MAILGKRDLIIQALTVYFYPPGYRSASCCMRRYKESTLTRRENKMYVVIGTRNPKFPAAKVYTIADGSSRRCLDQSLRALDQVAARSRNSIPLSLSLFLSLSLRLTVSRCKLFCIGVRKAEPAAIRILPNNLQETCGGAAP